MSFARGGAASTSYVQQTVPLPLSHAKQATRRRLRPMAYVTKAQSGTAVKFSKFHGLGNDFLLVDNRHQLQPVISAEQAVHLCDRNFGVGGDGVIFALPPTSDKFDYSMRIFNSDGSEPEMCGNGIRCLAKFVAEIDGSNSHQHRVHTPAGLMQPSIHKDGQVCVDMGPPTLHGPDVPTTLPTNEDGVVVQASLTVPEGSTHSEWSVTCVSMGNPHAVVYARDGRDLKLDDFNLAAVGPSFEKHAVFPAKTNTEFVEVLHRGHVRMTVWERGAGRTLACGTGACALVVAGVLEGRIDRACRVDLPGGPLQIEWHEDNHVYMTGPAEFVFSGTVQIA